MSRNVKRWAWLVVAWLAWNIVMSMCGLTIITGQYWILMILTHMVAVAFYYVLEGELS